MGKDNSVEIVGDDHAIAAMGYFDTNTNAALRELVAKVAENARDALKRNVASRAYKTGNLYRAITIWRSQRDASGAVNPRGRSYTANVGFTNRNFKPGNFAQSPLAYVYAQNYGSDTHARMHAQVAYDPSLGGFKSKFRVRDGEDAGNFATWITHRTIPPQWFIEDAQTEALASVDAEVSKFDIDKANTLRNSLFNGW